MKLDHVVPWGRTRSEYVNMFTLTDADLAKKILGIGDGPASFNAEMTADGYSVTSIDPIYAFSAEQLKTRISDTYDVVMKQMQTNAEHYNWTAFRDVDELGRERMRAMNQFLDDYEEGKQQGRYQTGSLPVLPFQNRSFGLSLCSHLLFLYSDQLSESFHLAAIQELIRVADEVRIFPLVSLNGQLSPYLDRVLVYCKAAGIRSEIESVNYHFQKGAFQVLRLTSN